MVKTAVIIVMGVSGAGKTTVGKLLAAKLGWQFKDADDFHSQQNKAKMHSGMPLTDEDRQPWLENLATNISEWLANGKNTVLACSALKECYRSILRGGSDRVALVYLRADFATIAERLEGRKDHFMNKELLRSQFAALEEPDQRSQTAAATETAVKVEEHTITVNADQPPENIVNDVLKLLISTLE